MPSHDWKSLFTESNPEPGAGPLQIEGLRASLVLPPLSEEVAEIRAAGVDPSGWVMPAVPLPPSYLDFLAWSNGGLFLNGDREFSFLGCEEVRQYLLTYHVPASMPKAIPFALNGGGCFYLFDARREPGADGEYPILFADAGKLNYDDAVRVADSFPEVCQGTTDLEGLLSQ